MKLKTLIEFTYKSPVLTGVLVFVLTLSITQFITYRDYQIKKNLEKQLVIQEAIVLEKKLNTILNQAYAATSTLQFAYEFLGEDLAMLDRKSAEILTLFPVLDILQVVKGGVITYVFPLAGNEAIMGYDILRDPKTAREANLAIDRKNIFFAGPFELKQGGIGIVGRLPIFKNDVFWGFSAAIIKLNSFQEQLLGENSEQSSFYVQFSKVNPTTQLHEQFLPVPDETPNFNGYQYSDIISDGDWELSIQLKKSSAFDDIVFSLITRFILSILLGLASYYQALQPKILEKKVINATRRWKKSNRRFEIATQATSDIIWDWSIITGKVYRSKNFEKIFGYPLSVFTSDTNFWNDHIHPDDLPRVLKRLNTVIYSHENYWEEEFRFLKSTGEYADVVDKGIILRDKEGNPVRIIGATQDITKTKNFERKIQQEKDFLNSLLDNLTEGVITLDHKGKILLTNKKTTDILGLNITNLQFIDLLKSLDFLTYPGKKKLRFADNPLKNIIAGENIKNFEMVIEQNGKHTHILVSTELLNIQSSEQPNIIIVLHDISNLRAKDLDLAKVTHELNKRAEALELSNAELERFAYVTSHNLQEPLRMVTSFVKLIQSRYGGLIDEKGKSYIQYALDGADRMKQLIMDVLEYSLADMGDEKTEVSLEDLLNDVKTLERALIQETDAKIICENPITFRGVQIQIRQLFQNLINNSLKFAKDSETLEVKVQVEDQESAWLFKVIDNGKGIKEHVRKKIFNIFEKDQQQKSKNSSGVGLAICKKIVNKHGGNIWIESRENMGTTVFFTIEK